MSLTVDKTFVNEPHAVKWHSVVVNMVMVDCVIIACIRCKDLLCLLNYMQLYSWFILDALHYIGNFVLCIIWSMFSHHLVSMFVLLSDIV